MDVSTEHIEIVQGARGPKPVIKGTRIRIRDVVNWYVGMGWSVGQILEEFPHLTPAGIHAALAYYWDHRDELEATWAAIDAEDEEYMRQHPSPLREVMEQRRRQVG
jgi:uncharacterized protein (DUF433 family)